MNQCEPITRSGRDVRAASAEIENCEVLEAKITSSPHTASSRPSTSALTSRSSITHSITWPAASPAVSSSVENEMRERTPSASSSVSFSGLHEPPQAAVDPRARAVERVLAHVDQRHVQPRRGDDLRDPVAHHAAAGDEDVQEPDSQVPLTAL